MSSRLDQVLEALKTAASNALNAAGVAIPSVTIKGWPVAEDLKQYISDKQYVLSLYPTGNSRNETRYRSNRVTTARPVVGLTATVSGNTITFSGTVAEPYNVHALVGNPIADALYQSGPTDNPTSVAAGVAAKINALGISGLSAASSANVTTVTGPLCKCNVSGSNPQMVSKEVSRVSRDIQITVWAPDNDTRMAVGGVLENAFGGTDAHFLPLGDGTALYVWFRTDRFNDAAEATDSVFRWDFIYEVEYGILQVLPGTQVGVIESITVQNNAAPVTAFTG
jgi:hypothetical protein